MRVVVTGGAGFIGQHVVRALLERGDSVHVLDRLVTGRRSNVPPGATLHVGDVRSNAGSLFALVRPELCVHLAAQADVGTSVLQPELDADVNVMGTVRVLEAARAVGARVVFSSSGAVYGECNRPAGEDAPRRPLSPYGVSKLAGEEYLAAWNRQFGGRHVALRLANVYGPGQRAGTEGGVVATFLSAKLPVIDGDGLQTRDFVHVSDVVRAVLAASGARRGGAYNVGTGVETSVLDLLTACRGVAGAGYAPRGPAREDGPRRSVLDPSLAERALAWSPAVDLREGLRLTWEAGR